MSTCDRRTFLATSALAGAFHIVPRHVLGKGFVAPSDKVTLAYIGLGTQGLRALPRLLDNTDIQVVAVCDPNKESTDYLDWSRDGIRSSLARFLGQPSWREGTTGIAGGREVGRDVIERHYGKAQASGISKGCASYADFRELLERERDLDAVKIMTPDHLHATIAIAAMKRGKHVLMHKPLANRVSEARLVIETARRTGVVTHFLPWDSNGSMEFVKAWIDDGAIGTLREIHNWTNRPTWPQYTSIPTDTPPVPANFDWDLWLGPEQARPYHPHYTHMVFRGWYDFGGGSLCDMGHYSLWTVFRALDLGIPVSVEPMMTRPVSLVDGVSRQLKNDFSFPPASTLRFRFATQDARPSVDLFWYEGGMRPPTPPDLESVAPDACRGISVRGRQGPDPVRLQAGRGAHPAGSDMEPVPWAQATPASPRACRGRRRRVSDGVARHCQLRHRLPRRRPDARQLPARRPGLRNAQPRGGCAACRCAVCLRSGCHADHQPARRQPLPHARVSPGLGAVTPVATGRPSRADR